MTSQTRTRLSIALLVAAVLAARSGHLWVDIMSAVLFGTFIYIILGHTKGTTP